MIFNKYLAAASACCLLMIGSTAGAKTPKHSPRYRVVPIDARLKLDLGGNHCLNNSGVVVGRVYFPRAKDGSQPFQAYRWEKGKLSSLGVSETDLPSSYATAINDREHIVGTITVQPSEAMFHSWGRAFFSKQSQWQDLSKLLTDEVSYGVAVNNTGDVAIAAQVLSMLPVDDPHPETELSSYLVRAGKLIPLGYGGVVALNNKGQVLIGKQGKYFLWANQQEIEAGPPTVGDIILSDMNDHRQMIGKRRRIPEKRPEVGQYGAFLYESGHMTYLTHDPESIPTSLNSKGQIVGNFSLPHTRTQPQVLHAFLWQKGKFSDLNSLVSPKQGWVFRDARCISDRGQIVGTGTYRGKPSGFLLTPVR